MKFGIKTHWFASNKKKLNDSFAANRKRNILYIQNKLISVLIGMALK